MNVLVVYGSTEGQTRKIAEQAAKQAREAGEHVDVRNCADWQEDFQIDTFDRIIIAGSVHQKRHQRALEIFVIANRDILRAKPTLFLSVSLSVAFDDGADEAQSYADAFFEYTDWTPTQTLLVAGAIRYEEYDYFMDQIVQHVVLKGRDEPVTDGEHEYTDWDALALAVKIFLKS